MSLSPPNRLKEKRERGIKVGRKRRGGGKGRKKRRKKRERERERERKKEMKGQFNEL